MSELAKGLVIGLVLILIGIVSLQAIAQSVTTATETTDYTNETITNADLSTGRVGLWHFDVNSSTTATDSSGSGNDGNVTNTTWTDGGKYGGAHNYEGEDHIIGADSASLNITGTAFTISAWVMLE